MEGVNRKKFPMGLFISTNSYVYWMQLVMLLTCLRKFPKIYKWSVIVRHLRISILLWKQIQHFRKRTCVVHLFFVSYAGFFMIMYFLIFSTECCYQLLKHQVKHFHMKYKRNWALVESLCFIGRAMFFHKKALNPS